jgi:hypothetical protein
MVNRIVEGGERGVRAQGLQGDLQLPGIVKDINGTIVDCPAAGAATGVKGILRYYAIAESLEGARKAQASTLKIAT